MVPAAAGRHVHGVRARHKPCGSYRGRVGVVRQHRDRGLDWSAGRHLSQLRTQLNVGGPEAILPVARGAAARLELELEGWAQDRPLLNWLTDVVNSRKLASAWRQEAKREGDDQLTRHELREFSQNGEDGIIRWVLDQIGVSTGWFLEIGAADGEENCTRQLLEHGWSGAWVEADGTRAEHAREVAAGRLPVINKAATPSTISDILADANAPPRPDLVVVDIDGNDWWVLGALLCEVSPRLLVVEYNATYKPGQWWVHPYRSDTSWDGTYRHGASLEALARLAGRFDYSLIGCDSSGTNAFFLSNADLRESRLRAQEPAGAQRAPWFAHGLWGHPRRGVGASADGDTPRLTSDELSHVSLGAARRFAPRALPLRCGGPVFVELAVRNQTDQTLTSRGLTAFNVAFRWRAATDDPKSTWSDEPRRPLPPIAPKAESRVRVRLPGPSVPGTYKLDLALVQENVRWLNDRTIERSFTFNE